MLKVSADNGGTLAMPDVSNVFASAATYLAATSQVTKSAGGGDSVRNQKSSVKAPGGKDAAKQMDGG